MPALHVLQRVVSGVAVPLLKSADSVIEGHVLLKAGFLFLVAYPESNSENVIYLLCHTSSVVGRQALNSVSTRVVAYVYCDA